MPTASEIQALIAPLFPGLMGITLQEATTERVLATMVETGAQGTMPTCPLLETLALDG